jgi:hypothetical protein
MGVVKDRKAGQSTRWGDGVCRQGSRREAAMKPRPLEEKIERRKWIRKT